MKTVSYTLTFETQSGTAEIKNMPWQMPQYFLTHAPDFRGGEFHPLHQMSFWHHGDAIHDFSGQTFDVAEMLSAPPAPIEGVSWDGSDPFLQNPRGHLTFGSGNSIVGWYIETHDSTGSGESDAHWSTPRSAVDSALANLEDPSIFEGRSIYGDAFSHGDDHVYHFNPGRWRVSAQVLGSASADEGLESPDLLSQAGPAAERLGSGRRHS